MKLKELLHSQVPEEGGPACHSGDRVRGAPGNTLSQAGGGPREREDPRAGAFIGLRWSTQV